MRRLRLSDRVARARRSTIGWAAATLAVSLLAGGRAWSLLDRAASAAAAYRDEVNVVVAREQVAAGEVVRAGALERRAMPAALVPRAARPTDVASAAGRVALAPLVPGGVVVEHHLGSSLVPAGWRGVAVLPPPSGTHPRLGPGDLVEVLDVAGGALTPGVVVDVADDGATVTVAVPAGDAARVAHAAVSGTAVLAVIAAQPPR